MTAGITIIIEDGPLHVKIQYLPALITPQLSLPPLDQGQYLDVTPSQWQCGIRR